MTILYILLALVAAWVVYRMTKAPNDSTPPTHTPEPIDIPIQITVTTSGPTKSTDIRDANAQDSQIEADKDSWEGSFWEVVEPLPARATLRLIYVDGAGRRTERTVNVMQFGSTGSSTLILGHCSLRNATRTFRSDRIQSCIDEETGEVVSDVRGHLQRLYELSPDKAIATLRANEYDVLRVLYFVGKADGQLRAAEKAVVRDACAQIANDSRLTVQSIDELFGATDLPTLQAFRLAVGRLAQRDLSLRTIVMNTAEKIVATQKSVHPSEQEALDYMRKRLFPLLDISNRSADSA